MQALQDHTRDLPVGCRSMAMPGHACCEEEGYYEKKVKADICCFFFCYKRDI